MIELKTTERPLLHKVDAVCQVLQISRTAIYGAIQRGQVRIVKIGRSTRISQDEVERIAREGLEQPERRVIDTHDPFSAR